MQKLLAAAGVASRREAEKLITDGRVAVNGKTVTKLGTTVDPDTAKVTVDGKKVDMRSKHVYILLNKPHGYTSTRKDPHAPRVVTDLVKDVGAVYPVGRLDVQTEGLLLLSNDGDFAYKVTHPKHHVPKTYRAEVRGQVTQETLEHLANGVMLDDGMTAPAEAHLLALNTARQTSVVELIIREGRKRQVRRMLEIVGHPVMRLVRTKVGNLTLGKLKPGEWRFLTDEEVKGLLGLAQ
ncbi:MAG: pseudouridine synthase [Armatimonadota bacterium]